MTQTTDRTVHDLYHYEKYVKPLLIEADKAQAKFKPKEYEWVADYRDGEKLHTEKVIEIEKDKDWIDSCLKPIPISDYAHFKARERDIDYYNDELSIEPNYLLMYSCLYFFMWYSLPLLILLYLA
tara:strand:+ start:347 stop:721 length:375 start_codon:yes stop_codon:yes gene_type:complete